MTFSFLISLSIPPPMVVTPYSSLKTNVNLTLSETLTISTRSRKGFTTLIIVPNNFKILYMYFFWLDITYKRKTSKYVPSLLVILFITQILRMFHVKRLSLYKETLYHLSKRHNLWKSNVCIIDLYDRQCDNWLLGRKLQTGFRKLFVTVIIIYLLEKLRPQWPLYVSHFYIVLYIHRLT